ncbi:MAG: M90 family metallopeptidase [Rhodothermales bacterium]
MTHRTAKNRAQSAVKEGKLFLWIAYNIWLLSEQAMRIVRPSSLVFFASLAVILGGTSAIVGAQTMTGGGWFGVVPILIVMWRGLRIPWRRWRVARHAFPPAWRLWLKDHVTFYDTLNGNDRMRFERDVQFFLAEHTFEAVDGVELTDTLRLGVAAGAAMLLHGRPNWELSTQRGILFYPGRFDEDYYDGDYAVYDGMVHAQGPVILSAPAVEQDWTQPGNGHNVVLHELAHLFDFEKSHAEGTPSLMDPASARAWHKLVRREMRRIRLGKSLLRRYAATNQAEFFAVAVENFFDRPELLKRRHPRLFDALVAFFNLNPIIGQGKLTAMPADKEDSGFNSPAR